MNRWRPMAVPAFLAAGLLGALLWLAGLESVARVLKGTSLPGLMLAGFTYAVTWIFRTGRLRLIVRRVHGPLPAFTLFRLQVASFALNAVLPARIGDAANVVFLHTHGVGFGAAAAVVLHCRVLDAVTLVVGATPALLTLLADNRLPSWVWGALAFGGLFALLPSAAVLLDRIAPVSRRLETWVLRRVRGVLADVVAAGGEAWAVYRGLVGNRGLWLVALGWSLALVAGEALSSWCIARAVGAEIPLLPVLSAIALGSIGKGVPVTPGGIGVYEAVCSAVLVLFDVNLEVAVTFALLDHALKKAFNAVVGLTVMGTLRPPTPLANSERRCRSEATVDPDDDRHS